MSKNYRFQVLTTLALLAIMAIDTSPLLAQRIVIGGNQSSRNRDNKNNDKDDEEEDSDQSSNNSKNNNSRSGRSSSRTQDQINQLLKRAQSGQGGQGGQSGQPGQGGRGGQGGQGGRGGRGPDGGFNYDNQDPGADQFRQGNRQNQFPGGQDGFQQMFRPKQSNVKIGGWQDDRWQGSRHVNNWSQAIGGGKQPFSSQWYKDHPKAWKFDNDNVNFWVTASLPGVYNWLGWGNVPPQFNGGIVKQVPGDMSRFRNWYPLGVYSLMSGRGDMGTRVVQLAIDRHGHIAGNYYDMITDTNSSISGDVRRQSQRAYWSLNKNKYVRFEAPLYRLLQPYGYITVQLPGGDQDWQFVRLEN